MNDIVERVAKAICKADGDEIQWAADWRQHAQAAIAAYEAALPAWQTIDTAPKDGTTWLLIYDSVHRSTVIARYHADASAYEGPYGRFVWEMQEDAGTLAERSVTHWMPLPEAPAPIPHDGSTTSVVKDSLTTADTTQEKT